MPVLDGIYLSHPAWVWAAAAAALLAVEVAAGSGWLLWPAASAGVVALISAFLQIPTAAAVLVFAALTILSTATARRYFPRRAEGRPPDINDPAARLVGRQGRVVAPFRAGAGRVFVDGKEWAAELAEGPALEPGARIEVTAVTGARLKVRGL